MPKFTFDVMYNQSGELVVKAKDKAEALDIVQNMSGGDIQDSVHFSTRDLMVVDPDNDDEIIWEN